MSSLVVIVANPTAARATELKLSLSADIIKANGYEAQVLLTKAPGDAERLAHEVIGKNPRVVIAAGGDGTINEVANALVNTGIPMGILPLGNMNVLALETGIPKDIKSAVLIAIQREPRNITVGKIMTNRGVRYFCLMAGIGYDAAAVYGLNPRLKRISGVSAHVISGLLVLKRWSPARLSVNIDGLHCEASSLIVCNASRYAGPFRAAPDARIEEPDLKTYIMHGMNRTHILKYVFGLLSGTHTKMSTSSYMQALSIEIEGVAHIQTDGDYAGTTPATITAEPNALRLVY